MAQRPRCAPSSFVYDHTYACLERNGYVSDSHVALLHHGRFLYISCTVKHIIFIAEPMSGWWWRCRRFFAGLILSLESFPNQKAWLKWNFRAWQSQAHFDGRRWCKFPTLLTFSVCNRNRVLSIHAESLAALPLATRLELHIELPVTQVVVSFRFIYMEAM
jgi:hypothetical protein